MLSFSKLWLEDNGDKKIKTFIGAGCRGCWLKTYLWIVLVDVHKHKIGCLKNAVLLMCLNAVVN